MKNDTSRAAKTAPFDERANEDTYFAEREHELVDAMKVEYLKGRAARRVAAMNTCPKCSGQFQKHPIMGIILERCESCEGIWLNKGELENLLRQQARGPLGIFLDRCFAKSEISPK